MPITPTAARDVARNILAAYSTTLPPSEIEVSLAASLILKAVERDELQNRARDAELRLIELGEVVGEVR